MIDIYRQLRTVVDKTVDIYNQKVKENKEKGLEAIEKIPNYFPHIFQGDFAVFVKKWSGNKKGYRPIEAPGAPNKLSVNPCIFPLTPPGFPGKGESLSV